MIRYALYLPKMNGVPLQMSAYQMRFLMALADGVNEGLSSVEVLNRYRLVSSANVVAGGFGLRHSPPLCGIEAPPFPALRCCGGIWPPAFPALLAGGALATTGKNSQSARWRPVFFCTPSIPYASKLATVCPGTKKALKRCLRAFFPLLR